jgi:hypothetical protein
MPDAYRLGQFFAEECLRAISPDSDDDGKLLYSELESFLLRYNGLAMALKYGSEGLDLSDCSFPIVHLIGESTLPFRKPFETLTKRQFMIGRPDIVCPGSCATSRQTILTTLDKLEDGQFIMRVRSGQYSNFDEDPPEHVLLKGLNNVLYGLNLKQIMHVLGEFIAANALPNGKPAHNTCAFQHLIKRWRSFHTRKEGMGAAYPQLKTGLERLIQYMEQKRGQIIYNADRHIEERADAVYSAEPYER